MENPFLDNQYLTTVYPLSALGEFLVKLGENARFAMNVKDLKTGKFCLTNPICSNQWGLTPQEMHGMDNREAMSRVTGFKNLDANIGIIYKNEQEAIQDQTQKSYQLTNLLYNGFISLKELILIPVFGRGASPIAIASLGLDVTPYANLLYLLNAYEQFYKKSQAVKKLSEYLKLDTYFHTPLNRGELSTLLAMIQDHRAKKIAAFFKISPKTIRFYIYLLQDKLKSNVELYFVLSQLRRHQQWLPNHEIS